jgi:hypothetical protein
VQNLENQDWDHHETLTRLRECIEKATLHMLVERAKLAEGLAQYQAAWHRAQPDAPVLEVPTLRVAAYVIAMSRCRAAITQRGVWP